MPEQKPAFPLLFVSQILDKVTLVLTGPGVREIKGQETLIILAVGRMLKDLGVPLVLPKATVVVEMNAGLYIVAKTPLQEYEESTTPWSILGTATKTVRRRPALAIEEKALVGNPASEPVAVGDPVVRAGDVQAFIRMQVERSTTADNDQKAEPR